MRSSLIFLTDCGSSKPIGTVCLAKIDTKLSLVPAPLSGNYSFGLQKSEK